MWTEGWGPLTSREHPGGVLSGDDARYQLRYILTHLSYLQWHSDLLDEINEVVDTTVPLRVVGYMFCRDELIGTPLWDELSDEIKCQVITTDDESIEMWVGAVLDGVMSEYLEDDVRMT